MVKKRNGLILACFIIYFVVLLGASLYSLVMSLKNLGFSEMFGSFNFNFCVYGMMLASIGLFVICFLFTIGKIISVGIEGSFKMLNITAGVLLISGMVNTPYSLDLVKFLAYFALLIGYLLKYLEVIAENEKMGSSIASYVYLVAFSMAIPVVYDSDAAGAHKGFYVIEALSTLFLIGIFTIMAIKLFGNRPLSVNNILFCILLLAVVIIDIIVATSTGNKINWFSFISACLAVIAYVAYRVLDKGERRAKII